MPMSSPNYSTSPSYSPSYQNYPGQPIRSNHQQQYYLSQYRHYENSMPGKTESPNHPVSPELSSPAKLEPQEPVFGSTLNVNAPNSPQLSPVFKSEAAKQIIKEMTEKKVEGPRRRQIPREKRRHYTVSSSKPVLDLEDAFSKMVFYFPYFMFLVFSRAATSFPRHSFNVSLLSSSRVIFLTPVSSRRFVMIRVSTKTKHSTDQKEWFSCSAGNGQS